MIPRSDLQAEEAPHCEVVQLTSGALPSSHLYMEAQIFAPDSSRFLLHESATEGAVAPTSSVSGRRAQLSSRSQTR